MINDAVANVSALSMLQVQKDTSDTPAPSVKLRALTENEPVPATNSEATLEAGQKAAAGVNESRNGNTEDDLRKGRIIDVYA